MNRYSTRAQLKAIAREQLQGKYLTVSSAFLVLYLLQNFITSPAALLALPEPWASITYYGVSLLIGLFFAIFQVGLSYLFLSNACGQRIQTSQIYSGFTHGPMKAVSIWVVPTLLLAIPVVLPNLLLDQVMQLKGTEMLKCLALWICVVYPLAMLIQLIIKIPYSMSFYIMLDFPEMDAAACRRYSVKLMRGNKWRYFKLIISFLPLYLLGLLSFGIGLLYVLPYRAQTCANFYLDLMQVQNGQPNQ